MARERDLREVFASARASGDAPRGRKLSESNAVLRAVAQQAKEMGFTDVISPGNGQWQSLPCIRVVTHTSQVGMQDFSTEWPLITDAPVGKSTTPYSMGSMESAPKPSNVRPLPIIREEQGPREGLHRRARNYPVGAIEETRPVEALKVHGEFLQEDDDDLATLRSLYDRLVAKLEADTDLGIGRGENMSGLIGLLGDIGVALGPTSYSRTPAEVQDLVLRARPFLEKKQQVREGREILPGSPEDVPIPMRGIKLFYSNGDTSSTSINGTKKDVLNYMFQDGATGGWTDYSDSDPNALRRVVSVEFLDDSGMSTEPRDSWRRQ